jgi:hypothetical protein
VKTPTLNVAARMDETDPRLARCARRCAVLGWTDVELGKLEAGGDFRDILRSDGGEVR